MKISPAQNVFRLVPHLRIDHIFVSGHFKVHRVQVPRNHLTRIASDHLPLIADLDFNPLHRYATSPRRVPENSIHR